MSELPPELWYCVAKQIRERNTFHSFACTCHMFAVFSRQLREQKDKEFTARELDLRAENFGWVQHIGPWMLTNTIHVEWGSWQLTPDHDPDRDNTTLNDALFLFGGGVAGAAGAA